MPWFHVHQFSSAISACQGFNDQVTAVAMLKDKPSIVNFIWGNAGMPMLELTFYIKYREFIKPREILKYKHL